MITPPLSPPLSGAPSTPASTLNLNALRRPLPAHLNLSTVSPPYSQPVATGHTRYSQPPPSRPSNPYEFTNHESQRYNPSGLPPDHAFNGSTFDLHSTPTSPVSPVLHPAFPLAAGVDESPLDRWLRHEEMGRPIFPGSRTGSSIATSDISSVRGGMFGSLPGGRATGPSSRRGPGSVASAATRDRDNFTTSAPSYPSSRAGVSRPASRDEDAASFNGGSYPPSIISSDVYPPSIDARLQYPHIAPPTAPTPPRSYLGQSEVASSRGSTLYRIETVTTSIVSIPEGAATRPPRYSDSLPAPPYQLPLAELINNGVVGYQGVPILTYGASSAAAEKAMLGEIMDNPAPVVQGEEGVVMVRQEVWEELRRRAGLDGGIPDGTASAVGNEGSSVTRPRDSLNRRVIKQRIERSDEDVRCCGACIIS